MNFLMNKKMAASASAAAVVDRVVSFMVFCVMDAVDFMLCYLFKVIDFLVESEWKPCYCVPDNILVSEKGESKIVCLDSTKLQLEGVSDTLYSRPSLMTEVSKSTLKKINQKSHRSVKKNGIVGSTVSVHSSMVEMIPGKIGGPRLAHFTRWSDCDCHTCASWTFSGKDTLYVKADGAKDNVEEDVIFIHGFISSSAFWTETLFPNFSKSAKSKYRLLAFDLLGFGRSPKPVDSLYTVREHVEMIEKSVVEAYKVKSFHVVAHSLGCILALALAVRHPASVKSLTLLAPPYFPVPRGERATQYMMRRIAPRRIWPLISLGTSIACWYEHISRTICFLICKNHLLWEFLTKLLTRNRIRTYLMEGFWCHTHNAAWHTFHNIICGTAAKMEDYLDAVRSRARCKVTIYHGRDDELIPVECSYNLKSRVPRAQVRVIDHKDHLTIVVGRQQAFAKELERIWTD